jgi:hypothetical protein
MLMTCCAYSCTQYGLHTQYMLLTHADDLLCLQLHTVQSQFALLPSFKVFHLTPPHNSQELFFSKHHSITTPVGKAHYTLSIQSLKTSDYLRFRLRCVDCCTSTDVTNDVCASTFRVERSTKKSTTLALLGPNNYGTITLQNIERLPSAVTLLSEPQIFWSTLTITQSSVVSWITSVMCLYLQKWQIFLLSQVNYLLYHSTTRCNTVDTWHSDTIMTEVGTEFHIGQTVRRYSNFPTNYFKVDFSVNVSDTLLILPLHYHWHLRCQYHSDRSGFGGLEIACWPLISKFVGSHPAEAVR